MNCWNFSRTSNDGQKDERFGSAAHAMPVSPLVTGKKIDDDLGVTGAISQVGELR